MFENILHAHLENKIKQALIDDGVIISGELGPSAKKFVEEICQNLNRTVITNSCPGIAQKTPGKRCNYLSRCGLICDKCGEVHGR